MTALLRQAVLDAGLPEDRIHTVTDGSRRHTLASTWPRPAISSLCWSTALRWSGRPWRNGPRTRRTSRWPRRRTCQYERNPIPGNADRPERPGGVGAKGSAGITAAQSYRLRKNRTGIESVESLAALSFHV